MRWTLLVAVVSGWLLTESANAVDFARDIRPILSDRCFACHGPDEQARQADLRLDLAGAAEKAGVLAAGDPESSELWLRISSDDPDYLMPPPDSGLKLTDHERQQIRAWIEQGARYAEHWSFVAPVKAPLPRQPRAELGENEIDVWVRERLLLEGLEPAAPADRYTLVRRVTLDLTGLPPTADEVTRFVEDPDPKAYEKLVDRLLDSPHFGERMALDWLDAARYADTNGYSIDGGRHAWLWRDWVIQAFNDNKPYDTFLIEQLAGDLLPNPTPAQRIATGFQRNNMVTHEGGTIPEENLTNYNVDRVKTLGEAVLGLTLGCAQCHDHKYDPITQRDYYSLFAFFNTLADVGLDGDGGVNPRPTIQARTVLKTDELEALRQRIDQLRTQLASPPDDELLAWEQEKLAELARRGQKMDLLPLRVVKVSTPNRGSGFTVEADRIVRITQPGGLAAYDVLAELPASDEPITGLRVVFHSDPEAPGGGWGWGRPRRSDEDRSEKGSFRLTAITLSAGRVPADQVDLFRLLSVKHVTANVWQPQHRPENCLDPRRHNGWSPPLSHEGPVHLTVTFDQPISAASTPFLTVQLNFGAGENLIASRMELFALTGIDDGSSLAPEVIAALQVPRPQRTEEQMRMVREHFAAHAPQTERLRTDLANAEERLRVLTEEFSAMVMNVAEKPRRTFILVRGDYSQPSEEVSPDTPAALPKLDRPQQDRLTLAEWLTMPDHPLTARVYVNRLWQMMFGQGIVRTPADFGSQGQPPTHPELLDWLAVDFVESGWDVKRMVKKIVMSATYRQSSVASADLLERDPDNLLLARGPRFRLPAEFIRDAALCISGLLVPQLGGPSVLPYAPGDLWREISHYGSTPATAQTFVQDHGEKLYRRSLYTYWKRTSPPPNLVAFDAPNRETCVVSRPSTNTPLQALVMLNDVQFVEAARKLAERIVNQPGGDSDRLRWAVLQTLSRPATEQEIRILLRALERERAYFRHRPEQADALLAVGESPILATESADELAAWTQVASMLLNLSEFVTRN